LLAESLRQYLANKTGNQISCPARRRRHLFRSVSASPDYRASTPTCDAMAAATRSPMPATTPGRFMPRDSDSGLAEPSVDPAHRQYGELSPTRFRDFWRD
jgi:hypothetical protein